MIDIIGITTSGVKYGLIITGYTVTITIDEGCTEWTWQRCQNLEECLKVAQKEINKLEEKGRWV